MLYIPIKLYFSKNCSAYNYCICVIYVYYSHLCTSEAKKVLNRFTLQISKNVLLKQTQSSYIYSLQRLKKMELNTFYNEKLPQKVFG
jgi:hypothetical protein